MALKAGRVGVAQSEVDPNGKIRDSGSSSPVQSVGDGLQLSQAGEVSAKLGSGLEIDSSDAIHVKLGSGLEFDDNNAIKSSGGSGLTPYTSASQVVLRQGQANIYTTETPCLVAITNNGSSETTIFVGSGGMTNFQIAAKTTVVLYVVAGVQLYAAISDVTLAFYKM